MANMDSRRVGKLLASKATKATMATRRVGMLLMLLALLQPFVSQWLLQYYEIFMGVKKLKVVTKDFQNEDLDKYQVEEL